MRVLYVKMDKLVEKKLFERLLPRAAKPEIFPVVHRQTRRALLRRFPYGLYYRIVDDQIVVVACMHGRRNPRRWQSRN